MVWPATTAAAEVGEIDVASCCCCCRGSCFTTTLADEAAADLLADSISLRSVSALAASTNSSSLLAGVALDAACPSCPSWLLCCPF